MTPKPEPQREQKPSLGRIVMFRSREGIDMPAIITAVIDETAVHLEPFPPPGVGKPALSYEWGVDRADGDRLDGRWRWPERVS